MVKRVERSQLSLLPITTPEEHARVEELRRKAKLRSGAKPLPTSSSKKTMHLQPESTPKVQDYQQGGKVWQLVYAGEDTEYACVGLVPLEALHREPEVVVAVQFAIRTTGVDGPGEFR